MKILFTLHLNPEIEPGNCTIKCLSRTCGDKQNLSVIGKREEGRGKSGEM